MRARVVNDLDYDAWSEFVNRHPHGSIFQSPHMYRVWQATRHNTPFLLAIVEGEGRIRAVLQGVIQKEYPGVLGAMTARAIVWGGPLVEEEDDDELLLDMLFHQYRLQVGKRVIYSQFRNLWPQDRMKPLMARLGFQYEDHLDIHVDLSKTEQELWNDVHSKRRNEIRRARREGTEVRELTAREQVLQAYGILQEVYGRARLPLHHSSLFEAAFDVLGPEGLVRFFGAFFERRLIGVIVVLCCNGTVYDWYAGSLPEFYHKYPNDLLPWHVFLWAREAGYRRFDFGGAGKPVKAYGVRDYKKKFGGRFENFGRFEKVHKPFFMRVGIIGFTLWKLLRKK